MLIPLLQTLAEILAGGTSLISTEQIDFSPPGNPRDDVVGASLNLYFYDIRESKQVQHSGRQVERNINRGRFQPATVTWSPSWFDVSLLLTTWDRTSLGEYRLLNEALSLLLRHRSLREEFLSPELRGYGNLSMSVSGEPPIEVSSLWSALNIPLRPALYLTVTIPFEPEQSSTPLVLERIFSTQNELNGDGNGKVITKKVAIAGLVKSARTNLPLPNVEISVIGTEKSVTSNQEGVFFFEDLRPRNYVLTFSCSGYTTQNSNFLVDSQTYTFKEVLLASTS